MANSPSSSSASGTRTSPLNDWDIHTSTLALSLASPLFLFMTMYIFFLWESRTEVRLARRFIMINLGISSVLLISYSILAYYDIRNALQSITLYYTVPLGDGATSSSASALSLSTSTTPDILATPPFTTSIGFLPVTLNNLAGHSLSFPELRLLRPLIGIISSIFSLFINSHYIFRWFSMILHGFLLSLEILLSSLYSVQLRCVTDEICPIPYGYDIMDLYILLFRSYVTIPLTIFLMLSIVLIMGVMGWQKIRYPVILFSIQRLSSITHKARGKVEDDDDTEVITTGHRHYRKRTQGGGNLRTQVQAGVRIVWGATKEYFTRLLSGG